jgi:hypothetical protein
MFVENVAAGVSVVNVLVVVFVAPSLLATAVTVYSWETPSAQVVCQVVPLGLRVPGTGPDGLPLSAVRVPVGVTVTDLSVPRVAVTVTPADGSAAFAPLAGEMLTSGVALALWLALALPPAPALAPGLAALVLPALAPTSFVLLVHAAASKVAMTVTATATARSLRLPLAFAIHAARTRSTFSRLRG